MMVALVRINGFSTSMTKQKKSDFSRPFQTFGSSSSRYNEPTYINTRVRFYHAQHMYSALILSPMNKKVEYTKTVSETLTQHSINYMPQILEQDPLLIVICIKKIYLVFSSSEI